jgi:hypothetical protein
VPRGRPGRLGHEAKGFVIPDSPGLTPHSRASSPIRMGRLLVGALLTARRQHRSSSRLEMQGIFSGGMLHPNGQPAGGAWIPEECLSLRMWVPNRRRTGPPTPHL